MNRRGFLKLLGATSMAAVPVAAVIDWNPTARKIFLPPRGGWVTKGMSHEDIARQMIMRMGALKRDMEQAIYNFDPLKTPFVKVSTFPEMKFEPITERQLYQSWEVFEDSPMFHVEQ